MGVLSSYLLKSGVRVVAGVVASQPTVKKALDDLKPKPGENATPSKKALGGFISKTQKWLDE
jgi:hypothetical protein